MPWAAEKNLDTCYNSYSYNTRRYQALGAWDLYVMCVASQSVRGSIHTYKIERTFAWSRFARVPSALGTINRSAALTGGWGGIWRRLVLFLVVGDSFSDAFLCAVVDSIRAGRPRRHNVDHAASRRASYTIIGALRNLAWAFPRFRV